MAGNVRLSSHLDSKHQMNRILGQFMLTVDDQLFML